ncbi:allantoate amidohydrolase [Candidatus Sumerlaeota bacterium]|nr:allantoate amidohydrolase [Candidatus Sumerlaeota bacterium]
MAGGLAEEAVERCVALANHSETSIGLTRTYLSEPMKSVHRDVGAWMREAGMEVRVDAVGNIIGHYSADRPDAKKVMIGSHLDTVHNAGMYDGILGVVIGIEAIKSLNGARLPFAVEIVGFSEEEGVRFSSPFLGSTAIAGTFDDSLLARTDAQGRTLSQAIGDFGLNVDDIGKCVCPAGELLAYLEPHIEQGPVLETENNSLGIVSAIAGQTRMLVTFSGEAGHAGTVPMRTRIDALPAACELALYVERYGRCITDLFATVGQMTVEPNVSNVIPNLVRLSIDIRHPDDETRRVAVTQILMHANSIAERRKARFAIENRSDRGAVAMNQGISDVLKKAMQGEELPAPELVSGAGHDAMIMAHIAPTAMLFVRCKGGVSHHPDESVSIPDVADAIRVTAGFLKTFSTSTKG